MKCYNPLYRLFDGLNGIVPTPDLIAQCENSASPQEFADSIAKKASQGQYNIVTEFASATVIQKVNLSTAGEDAMRFATWWKDQ